MGRAMQVHDVSAAMGALGFERDTATSLAGGTATTSTPARREDVYRAPTSYLLDAPQVQLGAVRTIARSISGTRRRSCGS